MVFGQLNVDSLETIIPAQADTQQVNLLNKLAFYHWNKSPDKGIAYAERARAIAKKINYRKGEARALKCIGVNYWAMGVYDKANTYVFDALKIYEDLDYKRGIKSSLNNIGIIYSSTKKYEEAITYFMKAKQLAIEMNDIYSQVNHNNNIGGLYSDLENYEKALEYYNINIELSKVENVENIIYSSYSNMGVCLMMLGRDEEALQYMVKAYEANLSAGNTHQAASSADQLGTFYFDRDKLIEAYKYYKKAEQLAIESQALEQLNWVHKNLANYYVTVNDLQNALIYKDKYIASNDSLYNERSSQQMAEMRAQFESEKKEKENELLRKNITIQELEVETQMMLKNAFIGISMLVLLMVLILYSRFVIKKRVNAELQKKNKLIEEQKIELQETNQTLREQHDQLKILNATKDKFFAIISHDLRGSFHAIIGFTDILVDDKNNHLKSEERDLLEEINKSAVHTHKLLENLLTWAQSQTGQLVIKKQYLNIKQLVEGSIQPYLINASTKNINIKLDMADDLMLNLDRNTASTFIGNLVNNAIKFTGNNGDITIRAKELNEAVELRVIDTGIGMQPDVVEKLFRIEKTVSTKGTNNEAGTGLGLLLCKEFIEKNGGEISVVSTVNKGSEFIVVLPKD